ncbi:MAG: START domain-containing protein [Saprospiraceae bacterium]|nr:START domain-containing protein [Saprospiraceae bacterium]
MQAETTLQRIPIELDAEDWTLELDRTDVQVYSKKGASNADILGFKTITYHPLQMDELYHFLSDVNEAMAKINAQFVNGEVIEDWMIPQASEGQLVRTSFSFPFPFKSREFLHGIHSIQLDNYTRIVGYTPVDREDIPVQNGFFRCKTYISGQRITQLKNGLVRVEHLMVYELGNKISPSLQDRFFRKPHASTYANEWRNLRKNRFPSDYKSIDYNHLIQYLREALNESKQWSYAKKFSEGSIQTGRLAYCHNTVYRTDTVIQAPLAQVVRVLADESLTYLGQWNKEFIEGEVLEVLEDSPQKSVWLIKVHYKTPFFLANREYIYYFSREYISDKEVIITYHSIQSDLAVPSGFVRALLYPSVHLCTKIDEQTTQVQHLLATDLAGNLSRYQDSLLKGGLVTAQKRDILNQQKLFAKLAK